LVDRDKAEAAVEALTDGGWVSVTGESAEYLKRLARTRISGNYRKGNHGSIDLHISPFHFARIDEQLDEALWSNARSANLGRQKVLIPSPPDAIVITLAHAPLSDNGDWAIDLATRIAHQNVDWKHVAAIAKARGLVPSCLAGLSYMRKILGASIPETTLLELARSPVSFGARLKYWSNVRDRRARNLIEKAVNRAADRLLSRRGYSYFVKDHVEVTVARPTIPLRQMLGRAKRLSYLPAGRARRHDFRIDCAFECRKLQITLAVPMPRMSRRLFFDVCADGIAIARLRARAGGVRSRSEKQLTFSLPIRTPKASAVQVSVQARPIAYCPPDAGTRQLDELGPVEFRLINAWVA
jgi:hypothetical protein